MPEPGVYLDVPDVDYHADPALSSTQVRNLLPPSSTPAHFRWLADHGRPPTREFDIGHAVHRAVTGVGAPWVVPITPEGRPYEKWQTNDAKAQVAAARAAGSVPLKAAEVETVLEMLAALRAHPLAGPLLDLQTGQVATEVSLWWCDEPTGVDCRARFDILRRFPNGQVLAVDLKSCDDASLRGFTKTVWSDSRRYDQQEAWYRSGAAALDDPVSDFWFVLQEKAPPYAVGVYRIDVDALAAAHERNHRAVALYAECMASGVWPGYPAEVVTVSAPRWASW
jgi:hypothetical protein